MKTNNINTITKSANKNDVRISVRKESGKRVIGLHGFLNDVKEVSEKISGYYVEQTTFGFFLYSQRSSWN